MNSIKQIEVIYKSRLVGRLALTKEHLCAFEYSSEWISSGLIGADYRVPSIDYTHIFQVCATLTHSVAELWKVYRLMVFNYLIENKDDHAKNFSFIYRNNNWHLSPAYDLLPSNGMNGFHTTSINDNIEPTPDDLIAVAIKAGLNKKDALLIFEEMKNRIIRN